MLSLFYPSINFSTKKKAFSDKLKKAMPVVKLIFIEKNRHAISLTDWREIVKILKILKLVGV